MNKNINLIKILKDCPKGTEFYHAIYGRVWFYRIDLNCSYPIRLSFSKEICDDVSVTSKGLFHEDYDGECILFPSKEQRDWEKFSAPWYKKDRFDPHMLKPFDKVLVRDSYKYNWVCELFSFIVNSDVEYKYKCLCSCVKYCIPYNDETKVLLNTDNLPSEYYRYWDN